MRTVVHALLLTGVIELCVALAATFAWRLNATARDISFALTRAPVLDLMVSIFTWIPWVLAGAAGGWRGVIGAVLGQVLALHTWVWVHEALNRDAAAGPRLVKAINRTIGTARNHAALWISAVALPGFLMIRFLEIAIYPALVRLVRFPKYQSAEWVNVSRTKFNGLVGHDLIWGLYCDWSTGVYALGAEMLRNIESFYCPIRFYDGKKCDHCKLDFPDIAGGWVPADGTMAQVEHTFETMYGGPGDRAWFGHPVRLTVSKKPI